MKSESSYTCRNRYRRHVAEGSTRPAARTIILLIILLTALVLLMLTSDASAALGEFLLVAGFLTNATAKDGSSFDLAGSAYIEPGGGLRVNESGRNLVTNPSFEAGISGWEPLGAAVVTASSDSAAFGSSSMAIDAYHILTDYHNCCLLLYIRLGSMKETSYFRMMSNETIFPIIQGSA